MEKSMDPKKLKQIGYVPQRQPDLYSVRLRVPCGNLQGGQVSRIGELAHEYGTGDVHLTTRQGIQIPNVHVSDLEAITEELERVSVPPGSCGPRVRNVVACPGARECKSGLIDAYGLGEKIDERFFGREFPTKVKFAVTGCPNSCAKPQENDLGVIGVREPWFEEGCIACGVCAHVCPLSAISIEDEEAVVDWSRCNLCGKCVGVCPEDLIEEEYTGYQVLVGGRVGKHPQLARELTIARSAEEALEIFEVLADWIEENVREGERVGAAIDRVGLETLKTGVLP